MAVRKVERRLRDHLSSGCSAAMEGNEEESRSRLAAMIAEENESRGTNDHRALRDAAHSCAPNLVWREKVSQWCYDVADHLGESRDVVYLAMNVLDRYCVVRLSSSRALDERDYEIAAMTALFLAVRVTGCATLELPQVMRMSRLGVRINEILAVGKNMTNSLSWERRLTTPLSFVHAMLELLDVPTELKDSLLEAASYLVEVSVCDAYFSGRNPFTVGCAAVINATGVGTQCRLSQAQSDKFYHELLEIHGDREELTSLQLRLHHIYSQSEGNRDSSPHIIMDEDSVSSAVVPPIAQGTIRVISSSFCHLPSNKISTETITTTVVPETEPERVHLREESPSPFSKRVRST
jgi:hypothetical protein